MALGAGRSRIGLVGGLLTVAALLPAAEAEPIRSADELEERARVRVHTARVRIEPTSRARPGECLDLGVDDLKVRLRGDLVEGADILELERDRHPAVHALLIDTSGSMFGQLDRVRAAAIAYVERLDPEHDSAFVATFDESVLLASAVTRDRETLLAAIRDIRMSQLTSLNDGLYYTILELRAQRERPVILLLSDGIDTVSFYERHDVYDLVQRTPDLSVFTIGLALPYLQSRMAPGTLSTKRFLQRIASKTNGKYFDVPTAAGVEEVYLRIRDMLENEATLNVVDPDPDAEPGRLKVSSRSPACKIKVFKTWEAPEDDPTTMPIVEASGPLPRRFALPATPAASPTSNPDAPRSTRRAARRSTKRRRRCRRGSSLRGSSRSTATACEVAASTSPSTTACSTILTVAPGCTSTSGSGSRHGRSRCRFRRSESCPSRPCRRWTVSPIWPSSASAFRSRPIPARCP